MQIKKFILRNFILKIKLFYKLYLYYDIYQNKRDLRKKSFSQQGEDLFIDSFFKNKTHGFYVDIGCYHPFKYSNTFLLYQKKWSGINIDLNQVSIDLFNIARPNDTNICAAISNKHETVDLYFHHDLSAINSINKTFSTYAVENLSKEKRLIKKISTMTFENSIKNIKKLNKIDFLNIDVEGSDAEVLESFNLKKYNPTLVCIEMQTIEALSDNNKKCLKILEENNYKLLEKKGVSYIFSK
ncbi:MAG: hypothetical protein CBC24_03500 [Candidatus Pelagibacter sp. TMED64]|nr:SAM-dependent methyltransferase [Candidatus Pelagibacter sp.]OUU66286.1 MAG: hypothetical protein CBC24_03500 [Candidatus Pelagibacter sp. TMED64]|tara:strand:- start:3569 stop:4291 length:723 start_codon:yes stop_codon:yes gene_type:complete